MIDHICIETDREKHCRVSVFYVLVYDFEINQAVEGLNIGALKKKQLLRVQ